MRQILPEEYDGPLTFSAYVRGSGAGLIDLLDSVGNQLAQEGFSNPGNDWTLVSVTYQGGTPVASVRFRVDVSTSYEIKCAKLERGIYSTLVNDTPPNYAEELAKCQRYCVALNPYNHPYAKFGIGYPTSTTGVEILASLTVPLRAQPSITYSGNIVIKDYKDITNKTFTSLSVGWQTSNSYVVLTASGISGLTLGSPLVLQANNDASAQIILSADL